MALATTLAVELQSGGSATNGGAFRWRYLDTFSGYKWTASGSGTNEFYCELLAGGDPSLYQPGSVFLNGMHELASEGTAGSLSAGEWDYADNDTLGYSTIYVRLATGVDPDTLGDYFVGISYYANSIDYTQQASAQLALTDIASNGAGTTITSATGGFTDAMVGNHIYITGTGFTTGWYEITARTDTNTITIERSAGASASGGTGNVGGAVIVDDTVLEALLTAGCRAYVKEGTHTFSGLISLTAGGTEDLDIRIWGYNTTRSTMPYGTDRPLFSQGANYFITGNYTKTYNIRATTTASPTGFRHAYAGAFINCSVNNSSATAGRFAMDTSASGTDFIECEAESLAGEGIRLGSSTTLLNCYIHDCGQYGVRLGSSVGMFRNVIANNAVGMDLSTATSATISGNTFYGNTNEALSWSTGDNNSISFNIFANNGTALSASASHRGENRCYMNNLYNNTTNYTNVLPGIGDTYIDPEFADAANEDFTVTSASLKGFITSPGAYQGLKAGVFSHADIGAIQHEDTGSGGGETAVGYF